MRVNQDYTYEEVIDVIEHARRFGSLPGVEVTRRALSRLGISMEGMDVIHVAGTNGKGSVCAYLTEIMRQAGKNTGTFTSPHLIHFEERITVNGSQISREDVRRLGNFLLGKDFGVALTMFDYCLLMAVLYFREQGCETVVMETGLGGRLDSTNALGTPKVAVLTKIGLDHTAILGDTLTAIAREKAGIIKPGSYVVVERQETQEVEDVFRSAVQAGDGERGGRIRFVTEEDVERVRSLPMQMSGIYQLENAAAAQLAATAFLESLPEQELMRRAKESGCGSIREWMEHCCREGISRTVWRGRMQILSRQPFLLVDGAHNPQGVCALSESLKTLWPGEKFHFIMGVMADKDYLGMIMGMRDIASDFTAVTVRGERALQAQTLALELEKSGIQAVCAQSVEEALKQLPAKKKTVAFGSLYFVGEILKLYYS